jgi:hypothetical protein
MRPAAPAWHTGWLVGALTCLLLAGCGTPREQQALELYEATLDGTQEVPAVATAGSGTAHFDLDPASRVLRWSVTYSGLSGPVTAAHVHGPAGPGHNAGVLIPFTGSLQASPITGEARITPEQHTQLSSGQWYVNLHSARHPGGEIRGQIRPRR